jgi:ADP-heptose:LPS heptosyltransferase
LTFPPLLKFFARYRIPQKRLLIIKTDAIGDYILFRNFIEIVCKSEVYKNHEIHLLGNELWKEIALKFDAGYAAKFYFVNPDELYQSPVKTLQLGRTLFENNYEVALHPSFSRTFITDGLAGFTAAKQIIGFGGDNERISPKYKLKTDRFYTQLLPGVLPDQFEFEKSKCFFELVLNQSIDLSAPFMNVKTDSKSGIVIMPGAGVDQRRWETGKFIELANVLLKTTNHKIYLVGSVAEKPVADQIVQSLPAGSVSNLASETSLMQLVELIAGAALVISNETSAVHIAAAVKTRSICILGGGHFARFAPYATTTEFSPVCVYHRMECFNCNWSCKFQIADCQPFPCVAAVDTDQVLAEIFPPLAL